MDLYHDNETKAILYRYIQHLSGQTNLDENGGDLEDPHQGQIEPSLRSLSCQRLWVRFAFHSPALLNDAS
jgi:hypothetical protein